MRPLLLHASSTTIKPGRRRVVHIEYSPDTLPPPLRWDAKVKTWFATNCFKENGV
jgi:hypothetical protein